MATDVVVCAHDEARRLGPVLAAINGSPAVGSVIVVADSCSDATMTVAARYATVVPIDARDKGTAMAAGLNFVTTERVCFIDGDLVGLRPEHVSILCTYPPLDGQLVGVRGELPGGVTVSALATLWPSISGERRLPTAFARRLRLAGKGWRTETLINAAVARAGLPHRQVVLRGVYNPRKTAPLKVTREWAQVAGTTLAHGPSLARYVWTEE